MIVTGHSAVDRNAIEDIVKEILVEQGIVKVDIQKDTAVELFTGTKLVQDREEEIQVENIKSQNQVNDNMRAIIARTLSAFRSE